MAQIEVTGSGRGNALQELLMAPDIEPGDPLSYATCKALYTFHPFGAKIAEKPVKTAMSQKRTITVAEGPDDMIVEEFSETWKRVGVDHYIFATRVQSRIYGVCSIALLVDGQKNSEPVDFKSLHRQKFTFNVYDPLNTAGSIVLNQNPLAMDFQHLNEIVVNGQTFHRSRTKTIMNEFPLYISFTPETFGFTGRSVYTRTLFPLKSFIQTMITNDMVSIKAGVLIAKMKTAGAVVTQAMRNMFSLKRQVAKQAVVGNVVTIGTDEDLMSIDLKNLSEPFQSARKHIVEDIASGTPMPAKMLTEESFAEGFGEGTEDAKEQARFIDGEREQMQPLFDYFDRIVMHLAWTPDFFERVKAAHPGKYDNVEFDAFFYQCVGGFRAEWPNLLKEPDSELIKVEDVKLKALLAVYEVMRTDLDPQNKVELIRFVADSFNEHKLLFGSPLILDFDLLLDKFEEDKENAQMDPEGDDAVKPDRPFSAKDSDDRIRGALDRYQAALDELMKAKDRKPRRRLEAVK